MAVRACEFVTMHVCVSLTVRLAACLPACPFASCLRVRACAWCQVLLEFKEYATEVDVDFVRKAVRAIGRCAIKLEKAAERCINVLLELIKIKVNYVVQEAIIVIKDIFRRYPNTCVHCTVLVTRGGQQEQHRSTVGIGGTELLRAS